MKMKRKQGNKETRKQGNKETKKIEYFLSRKNDIIYLVFDAV